jgi:hypothetical protein
MMRTVRLNMARPGGCPARLWLMEPRRKTDASRRTCQGPHRTVARGCRLRHAGWIYVAICALIASATLALPLTHLLPSFAYKAAHAQRARDCSPVVWVAAGRRQPGSWILRGASVESAAAAADLSAEVRGLTDAGGMAPPPPPGAVAMADDLLPCCPYLTPGPKSHDETVTG